MPTGALPRDPLITLTTDFGTTDPYAGALAGALLAGCPSARLVVISHDVAPHDLLAGSYVLGASAPWFPAGTIHVAVVDPGVGGPRRALALRTPRHLYVGPDNGLLTAIYDREGIVALHAIEDAELYHAGVHPAFHGRDLFAPAAAHLALGRPIESLGAEVGDPVRLPLDAPSLGADGALHAAVLHVDRFGNVTTNLTPEAVERLAGAGGASRLALPGRSAAAPLYRTFFEAAGAGPFLMWGSSGYLEIALDRASAATALGLAAGATVSLGIVRAA